MRRILSLACGLGMMLGAADPAWAQATAEGAAKLKAAFEAWLPPTPDLPPAEAEYLTTTLSANQIIGGWQVEPDGDGYRIRTPGFRTAAAEPLWPIAGQIMLACDPDRWRATPGAGDTYALSADTPPACRLEGEARPAWPVSAGRRQTSGSIDLGGQGGLSLDTVLERVTARTDGGGGLLRIDRLTLSHGLKPGANGSSDLVQRHLLEGLSLAEPGGSGTVTADLVAIDTAADGTHPAAAAGASVALARRLAGLTGYPRSNPGSFLGEMPDMLGIRPFQNKLLDTMGVSGRFESRIEGLQATIPGGTIRIASLLLRFAFSGLDQEAGSLTVRVESQGMAAEPSAPYTAWIPAEATIQISGQDLPLRVIFADTMLPGEPGALYMARLLRESSTRILIDPFRLTAPEGLIDLTGAIWSTGDEDQMMPGRLQLRLAGLDALLKVMQADPDPQAAEVVAGLSFLQVLGRQATTPDGGAARDYEIVFGPEKGILVNGADVRGLLRELVPEPR